MKNRAFTLIELLIVVAIIAILAAIAVPNFLEAQTRAKVSRVQADLRSYATALESYKVDVNRYPFGYITIRQANTAPATFPVDKYERNPYALHWLTTPIAYMTSNPVDPFTYGSFTFDRTDDVKGNGIIYWYDDYQAWPTLQNANGGYSYTRVRRINEAGYTWSISSAGPNRQQMMMWLALDGEPQTSSQVNGHVIFPYDPTNGTISEGFVGRTNKGVYREVNQP